MPKTIQHSTRTRGYLPHWEAPNATYFVTFRLADSLPRELSDSLRKERERIARAQSAGSSIPADSDRVRAIRSLLRKAERLLDSGLGACHFRDPRPAKVVADALLHFQGSRYELFAWCVMPNHVHVLFSPLGTHRLETILHAWKSYTAHRVSPFTNTPRFWQREYFDHLVRNESSFWKFLHYIEDNPRKAHLSDWQWVSRNAGASPASFCSAGVPPAFFRLPAAQTTPRRRDGGVTKYAS